MIHIGIDSGATGAIAFIGPGDRVTVHDMPMQAVRVGMKLRNELNGHMLAQLIRGRCPADEAAEVWLEQIQARGQNAGGAGQSMGSQGAMMATFGGITAILSALRMTVHRVYPVTWKGIYSLGADKNAARERAALLYPAVQDGLKRKRDDGRADSLLIAHFGKQRHEF